MMDLNALNVFYWVGKLGGVGAAARKLKVTQPAVSQRLRILEKQLGQKLYGRAENRFVLTEEGRNFFKACQPGLESLASLEATAKGKPLELQGNIRIVALSEFSKFFLLSRIKEFRKNHPGVRFQMHYRAPQEMQALLLRHETDFTFTNELHEKPQIEAVPIFVEEFVFVGPRPKRRIYWEDLGRLPMLSCHSEDRYWYEFLRLLSKHGVEASSPAVEVADHESLLKMAAEGMGYVLTPLHGVKLRHMEGLAIHQLPFPNIKETIYVCRLKTVAAGKAAQAFWEYLLQKRSKN